MLKISIYSIHHHTTSVDKTVFKKKYTHLHGNTLYFNYLVLPILYSTTMVPQLVVQERLCT